MEFLDRSEKQAIEHEQQQILQQLEDWLELPMLILSFAWLGLFVVELTWGLTPLLEAIGIAIWGVFILEFILRLSLAPRKAAYLKTNWMTAISLLLPALRVVRFARVMRVWIESVLVSGFHGKIVPLFASVSLWLTRIHPNTQLRQSAALLLL